MGAANLESFQITVWSSTPHAACFQSLLDKGLMSLPKAPIYVSFDLWWKLLSEV
ncbi:hypothetical protein CIPAW_09G094600 [Carya illinoinensis]|uniref:Uncharacterized protein n=1 Tax=Carya illinoinensis TaxID=32201 RepID=A0A8T1PIE6_CARIL|nr:hypothetical protein CIPAW_09G094600 [Carya illinoinensis]